MSNENLERININSGGVPTRGYSDDREIFNKLAELVGANIPMSYIRMLRFANGGHPEVGSFYLDGDRDKDNVFDIDIFYPIDSSTRLPDVFGQYRAFKNVLDAKCLPIASDGGGNQIYMNLENVSETIWLYVHDSIDKKYLISQNFESFIESLIPNPDFI